MADRTGIRLDVLFPVLLLVVTAVMLVGSFAYRPDARLFPLIIGLPLATLLIVITVNTAWQARYGEPLFEPRSSPSKAEELAGFGGIEEGNPEYGSRFLRYLGWISVLLAAIYLLGFQVGPALFLFLYYKIEAGNSLLRAALYAVLLWAFVIVVFVVLLEISFTGGVLGLRIL